MDASTRANDRTIEILEQRTLLSANLVTGGELDASFGVGGFAVVNVAAQSDVAVPSSAPLNVT